MFCLSYDKYFFDSYHEYGNVEYASLKFLKVHFNLTGEQVKLICGDIAYCTVSFSPKPFSYSELSCQVHINSPNKNFTYSTSNITINVWLYIGGTEKESNTHYIPYEDISCLYSLDGAEWQNMTLLSAVKSELFPSIPNNYWYSNMRINFSASLIDVSTGDITYRQLEVSFHYKLRWLLHFFSRSLA